MNNLQELNLFGNQLTSITDLKGLSCLKKLNVGKNKLTTLANFPALPALEFFDASENQINEGASADGRTNELTNLKQCTNLNTLFMASNPWAEEKADDFKNEVLIALLDLPIAYVNDLEETGQVTDDDRTAAREQADEREKARLEAEKEAREAAEEQRLAEEAAAKERAENGEGEEAAE